MPRTQTLGKSKGLERGISPEATQLYIGQMLEELSSIAQISGLKNMAHLLKATAAVSQMVSNSETDA